MPPLCSNAAVVESSEERRLKQEAQQLKNSIRRDKRRLREVAAALVELQRRPIGIGVEIVNGK